MKKIINFVFMAFVLVGTSCLSSETKSIPIETLTATSIFEISTLNPGIPNFSNRPINLFALDERQNVYLLDMSGHRIMKYDKNGVFLAQIGSIGQTKEGLFNPIGLFLEKDLLYILNEGGVEIKIFYTDGKFRSSFRINNAWSSNSLCVIGNLIYINVIEKKVPIDIKSSLISVYSEDGRLIQTKGEIIKCNSLGGYAAFNEIILAAIDNQLFWAFTNIPLIGWQDLIGKNEGTLDLIKIRIPEMKARSERAKRLGFDSPETIKPDNDLQIRSSRYCDGFGVDYNEILYYVIQEFPDGPDQGGSKCYILVTEKSGKIVKKIILQYKGEDLLVSRLLFGPGNLRYGLGQIRGKTLLFNF